MAHTRHTIHIHTQAPAKVPLGAPCKGCGVCCLYAPCPLGILISRRRSGACSALQWDAVLLQYRCGTIVAPLAVLEKGLPRGLRGLACVLAPALRWLGQRWIAVGKGCDSNLEVEATTMPPPDLHNHTTERTTVREHRP